MGPGAASSASPDKLVGIPVWGHLGQAAGAPSSRTSRGPRAPVLRLLISASRSKDAPAPQPVPRPSGKRCPPSLSSSHPSGGILGALGGEVPRRAWGPSDLARRHSHAVTGTRRNSATVTAARRGTDRRVDEYTGITSDLELYHRLKLLFFFLSEMGTILDGT